MNILAIFILVLVGAMNFGAVIRMIKSELYYLSGLNAMVEETKSYLDKYLED